MKHRKQRQTRMAQELLLFAYKYEAKEVKLNIKNVKNETFITIEAFDIKIEERTVRNIKKLLSVPRSVEMEEYYWNLTGESDTDHELSILGVMSDKANVISEPNYLKIELSRKK